MGLNKRAIAVIGERDRETVTKYLDDYLRVHAPSEWYFDVVGSVENADVVIETIPYCNLSAEQSKTWNTRANWADGEPPFESIRRPPGEKTECVAATRYEIYRPINRLSPLPDVPNTQLPQCLEDDLESIRDGHGLPIVMLPTSPKPETNEFWLNQVICPQFADLLNNLTSRPDDPNLCGWRILLYQFCLTFWIAILFLGYPIFLVSSSQFSVPSRALAAVLAAALFWVTMTAVARMLTKPVQVTRRGINKFSVGTFGSTTTDVSAGNPLEVRQGIVSWALRVGFAKGRAISFDRAERLLADDENQLKSLIDTKKNYWFWAAEGLLLVASVVATAWLLVSHLGSLHG